MQPTTEGPATTITFLGIELNTVARTLHLPYEKLRRLLWLVTEWKGKRCCTKRELQSLIGQLQHATCVVRPGRSFLRRVIALLAVAKKPHHRPPLALVLDLDHWYFSTRVKCALLCWVVGQHTMCAKLSSAPLTFCMLAGIHTHHIYPFLLIVPWPRRLYWSH